MPKPKRSWPTKGVSRQIAKTKGANHLRGRLWYAMRVLRTFTASDLMAVAEIEKRHSVLTFLSLLRRSGYLSATYGNRGRHELTSFRLVRNSGPKCPSTLRNGTVMWDHNTETEYPING